MHLIHHRTDMFLGEPLAATPGLRDKIDIEDMQEFSDVESEFQATQIQSEIMNEVIQWSTSELVLRRGGLTLQGISNAWNSLASYHSCLRARLRNNGDNWKPTVQILRRIENIRLTDRADKPSDDSLAHVSLEGTMNGQFKLTIHFRRALIDATSLEMVRLDLVLLLLGCPPLERVGFTTYKRFLQNKNADESREFWAKTLNRATLNSAILPRGFKGLPEVKLRKSITAIVNEQQSQEHFPLRDKGKLSRKTFMELLWAYVLGIHTDSSDVVFGTVGRDRSFFGADSCVGCLDQTYFLRVNISAGGIIKDLAGSIDAFHSVAASSAFIGFNDIQGYLPPHGVVESVFNYTNSANPQCIAPALKRFGVVLTVCDTDRLTVTLTYIDDIAEADAQLLLEHFVTGLRNGFPKPNLENSKLEEIEIMSPEERARLLNSPAAPPLPVVSTLPALIETAVSRHPSKIAVDFEGTVSVTYSQLNALANGLAKFLRIRRGDIVALLIDRSINLVIAILAVLKSGAAYTILNGDVPTERNARVISECAPSTILADRKYSHIFPATKCVEDCLTASASQATQDNDGSIMEKPTPADRCYVIYTSGSTGKPKGSVVTHAAAVNGISHHQALDGLERCLLFYNPAASAAQRTFLSTLIHGGTIVLASKDNITSNLASVINNYKVDAMEITPTSLSLLQPSEVPRIKQITLAGEGIPEQLVDDWVARDNLIMRNRYGSSECTQLSFGRRILSKGNPRVLDNPVDTTTTYILRVGTTLLAPLGTPGELCLAGPQLSSGYLNEPELTARVFIDNIFGEGKLYRTGDKARRLADGSIEILGRIDWQVKINGNKVEPADVDHVLGEHRNVVACATFAVEMDGRQVLVAGIVLADGLVWSKELTSLRKLAMLTLPSFMVPSLWLPLTQLPRNANGKVDLHKLRSMSSELGLAGFSKFIASEDGNEPPANGLERKIARVWAAVLGIDEDIIGRHHSFLALGGNSVQAIKAISLLRKEGLVVGFDTLLTDSSVEKVALASKTYDRKAATKQQPFSLLSDSFGFLTHMTGRMKLSDAYPATPLQAALLSTLNSNDDPYTYRRVWDIEGADLEKVKSSFQRIFSSQSILRTGFVPYKKSIVQVVREDLDLPWQETSDSLETYMERDEQVQLPMSGPLFRVGIINSKNLIVTMHHALFDFWCYRFLYQDVTAAYFGRELIQRPKFTGFISYLLRVDPAATHDFWAHYLQGSPRSLVNHAPVGRTTKMSKRISLDLRKQTKALGFTLGSVVYSAWAMVLSGHLGSNDVSFVTSISGREVPVLGVEDMDGPTMSTVPQRIIINPQEPLTSLVNNVKTQFVQVTTHSHVGMREALRHGNIHPSSMDTLVNIPVRNENEQDLRELFKPHGERPMWSSPLTVLEVEEDGVGSIVVRMSSDMEPRRLQFLFDSFEESMAAILTRPDQPLSSINLLGDAEWTYLSNTLSNRDTLRVPTPQLLHAAFERHARVDSDVVAIEWDGIEQITYGSLDRRSNQMAAFLATQNVRPCDIVALMLDKSVEAVVCILGILKAGAAYVPLSPDNPPARNNFIIEQVGARLLVIHNKHLGFTSSAPEVPVVVADTLALALESQPVEQPAIAGLSPDNPAYVIYTSGSTGHPKGIKVPHRSAAAAVESMEIAESRRQGTWRTLQFANLVFDASVQDLFNTLSTGGTLCMAPTEKLLSDLKGCINRMRVRQAIVTPTVAGLIRPADVPGFETLIVGGEPLTEAVVETWKPACRVLNVYGPTETCMVVTTKDVKLGGPIRSIGAPFPTVMAFVVAADAGDVRLVPYGAVGELCIAGPQLSDGYVGRDDLTAAAFIHSDALGGIRMYRTGDLVRWLPGGEIECLGRKDNQVSIHGYRVELGEVETAVRRSGIIRDAAVVVAKINNKPHIVSFCIFDTAEGSATEGIQPAEKHSDNFHALRERLDSLPPYMLPKFVIPMGDFPKLPSRKVDRKALKKLVEELDVTTIYPYFLDTAGEGHEVSRTETPVEKVLEAMWSEVLSLPVDRIGREANFLSLGGDSISAIGLASLARQEGFELSVPNIITHPRLREMATMMTEIVETESHAIAIFETPESVEDAARSIGLNLNKDIEYVYPCPPGQVEFLRQGDREEQMWVLQTVRRMSSEVNQDQWIRATKSLTEQNDILRTTWLRVSDSEWVGCVLRSSELDLVRVNCQNEDDASSIVEAIWGEKFVFGKPFIRFAILTYPDHSWDLVIKMNHAVYDGTLLRIFDSHFAAILRCQEVPPHTEFKDFAFHVFSLDHTKSREYWSDKMARVDGITSNYSIPWLTAKAPCITSLLRRSLTMQGIEKMATELSIAPSAIFQGAFQLWLSRATTNHDISFDYLLSGRNLTALRDPQSINGTVANFLPVRIAIDPEESVAVFLARTQDSFWGMTNHGDIGLDEIYAAAGLDRATYGNRVLFLFQPFQQATQDDPNSLFRWLVMAKSKVRMYQPYALVVEVAKALGNAYRLTVFYDENAITQPQADKIGEEITEIINSIISTNKYRAQRTIRDIVGL